jgi:hypothetical protein
MQLTSNILSNVDITRLRGGATRRVAETLQDCPERSMSVRDACLPHPRRWPTDAEGSRSSREPLGWRRAQSALGSRSSENWKYLRLHQAPREFAGLAEGARGPSISIRHSGRISSGCWNPQPEVIRNHPCAGRARAFVG